MSTRKQLYSLGEPFGDSATRRAVTGALICGGGGDSSSSSSSQNTTNNVDGRIANQGGLVITSPLVGTGGGLAPAGRDATSGTSASVNAIINDPAAAIAAMDMVNTSTAAALAQSEAVSKAATQAAADSARAASDAATASANAMRQASLTIGNVNSDSLSFARSVSSNALDNQRSTTQGVFEFSKTAINQMFSGMDRILTAGDNLMAAEQKAYTGIASQIDAAYKTATDVSTGNKQLATAGMIVVGLMALFMMNRKAI